MKTVGYLVVALVCVTLPLLLWRLILHDDSPDSFPNKAEWACLQSVDDVKKGSPIVKSEFVDYQGHHLLCVPARGNRVWIMLDATVQPYYKQMPPDVNYALSQDDYDHIARLPWVNQTLLSCLKSHIGDTLPLNAYSP